MHVQIESTWEQILQPEFDKSYYKKLFTTLEREYSSAIIYPPQTHIFNAFSLCPFNKVSVVILGQDPYHGAGQAHGLAFSVPDGIEIPPSLKNIYKEMKNDLGITTPTSGNLARLATQGVLLLNSTLTVKADNPGSHYGLGWTSFTEAVIEKISLEKSCMVFLLWGAHAHSKRPLIDETKHLVLLAPHPSPLSAYRGFFGCKHFSKANLYLSQCGKPEIIW